jgi:hypothetical protein
MRARIHQHCPAQRLTFNRSLQLALLPQPERLVNHRASVEFWVNRQVGIDRRQQLGIEGSRDPWPPSRDGSFAHTVQLPGKAEGTRPIDLAVRCCD